MISTRDRVHAFPVSAQLASCCVLAAFMLSSLPASGQEDYAPAEVLEWAQAALWSLQNTTSAMARVEQRSQAIPSRAETIAHLATEAAEREQQKTRLEKENAVIEQNRQAVLGEAAAISNNIRKVMLDTQFLTNTVFGQIQQKLSELEEEGNRIDAEIKKIQKTIDDISTGLVATATGNIGIVKTTRRDPIDFMLDGSQVLPVDSRYFSKEKVTDDKGTFKGFRYRRRKKQAADGSDQMELVDGEPVEAALKAPSGCVYSKLTGVSHYTGKITPDTHVVRFYVSSDAIAAYRTVSGKVMDMGFSISWYVSDGEVVQRGFGDIEVHGDKKADE